MSDIENLKKKLVVGQNEANRGYKKFAVAQFYDNLTKEQFSGVSKRPAGILSASRDTLNPLLNTTTLKNRLAVIEQYKMMHGVEFAHWPHFALSRMGRQLYRYKFNYAIKGFALYMVYRDVAQRRHMHKTTFVKVQQDAAMAVTTLFHAGIFVGLCAFI